MRDNQTNIFYNECHTNPTDWLPIHLHVSSMCGYFKKQIVCGLGDLSCNYVWSLTHGLSFLSLSFFAVKKELITSAWDRTTDIFNNIQHVEAFKRTAKDSPSLTSYPGVVWLESSVGVHPTPFPGGPPKFLVSGRTDMASSRVMVMMWKIINVCIGLSLSHSWTQWWLKEITLIKTTVSVLFLLPRNPGKWKGDRKGWRRRQKWSGIQGFLYVQKWSSYWIHSCQRGFQNDARELRGTMQCMW